MVFKITSGKLITQIKQTTILLWDEDKDNNKHTCEIIF